MRELYSSPQISIKGHLSMDPDVCVCVRARAQLHFTLCTAIPLSFWTHLLSLAPFMHTWACVCVSILCVCRLHKHSMLHFFRVSHVCLFSTCRFPSSRTWFSVWKEHIGYLTLACGREAASTIMAALNCIPGQ